MLEEALKDSLSKIFGLKKTTFDAPSESSEQSCLFIDVQKPRVELREKRQTAQVEGRCFAFGTADKFPIDYFSKRIAEAPCELTRPFFFHAIGESLPIENNIVRRSVSFVFLFDAQYDPDLGTITSVDFQEGEGS